MNLSRVKRLISEQLRILSEQNPEPKFYDAMEKLYARKGCDGLEKKKDHFFSKRKKVVAKGNTKWADMLGIKIDHLDTLLAQYCSGGPQLPK